MNKFIKLSVAILAAGMFASCAENSADLEGKSSAFDAQGNAWMKLSINLPSDAAMGTRAADTKGDNYGQFNDGSKNEYAVEDAIVAIFSSEGASSEMEYKLIGAYELGGGAWNDDANVQITSNRTFVRQINNAGSTGKLYAYVIINKHMFFSLNNGTLKFISGRAGEADVTCNGMTLADFYKLSLKESGRRYDANSFLMTNMPYANVPGGTVNPATQGKTIEMKTLYPISDFVYATEAEASDPTAAAAEINVERVLAKVETTLASGTQTTEYNGYKFNFLGWFIDNTNPNSYVGRHFTEVDKDGNPTNYDYLTYNNAASNTWRFISENPVSPTQPGVFRTFWAVDPNYSVRADVAGPDQLITFGGQALDNLNLMKYDENGVNVGGRLRASGSHYYCTENTFDVEHQSVSNTTRIIVAAQFLDASDQPANFYTVESEGDNMYSYDAIKDYAQARVAGSAKFMVWAQDYIKASEAHAERFIDVVVPNPETSEAGRVTITVAENPKGLTKDDLQDATDEGLTKAITAYKKLITDDENFNTLLAGYEINLFKKGVSYYQALIQHFGEHETPWVKAAHDGKPNDVENIYDSNDKNAYLGRYGVVRNNWYKIDVTGVRQIGSPVVPAVPGKDPSDPDDPDTPDDQVENYLKVKINITPWVIRKQSVKL